NWPPGPFGSGECAMSSNIGLALFSREGSGLLFAHRQIEAPFQFGEMVPERNARLLLVSSQARPPSSSASFQKSAMNLTESMAPCELSPPVLPSASTSLPPHDQRYG